MNKSLSQRNSQENIQEFHYSGSFGLPPPNFKAEPVLKSTNTQKTIISQLNEFEQQLDQRKKVLLQKILPGYEKICSPIKSQTLQLENEGESRAQLYYGLDDDSSDAGTVVENSMYEYAEPDHFGIVETYQTQDEDLELLSEKKETEDVGTSDSDLELNLN